MKMQTYLTRPDVTLILMIVVVLVFPGCGNDDPIYSVTDPASLSLAPYQLVRNFWTAYAAESTDSLADLLHPEFQMILPSSANDLWDSHLVTSLSKAEMLSLNRYLLSGKKGRYASENMAQAVDSIAINYVEPRSDWMPISRDNEFFGDYEGLWARYEMNMMFYNKEKVRIFDVQQQAEFYVTEMKNVDDTRLQLLGIRELPMDLKTGEGYTTWSAILLPIYVEPWTISNAYIGSAACGRCHAEIYTDYLVSGHSRPFMSDPNELLDPGDAHCGSCHTTGYDPDQGTWEQDSITCEACHGMGRIHSRSMAAQDIVVDLDEEFCWNCHDIYLSHPASEQGTTFRAVTHPGGCLPCHDPHISARLDIGRAIVTDCVDCHTSETIPSKPAGTHESIHWMK